LEVYEMGKKKWRLEINIGIFFGMGINATYAAILYFGA